VLQEEEPSGCFYRSQLYIIVGTLLFMIVIVATISSALNANPLGWVSNFFQSAPAQEEPAAVTVEPLVEEQAGDATALAFLSGGGLVRAAPNTSGRLLYTVEGALTVNAVAQIRTSSDSFPTWVLIELPDEPERYGWVWIGVFEPESQEIGFDLPNYAELPDISIYPIGTSAE